MTTIADLVADVRSNVQGTLNDKISVLRDPHAVGDGHLVLRYAVPGIQQGTIVSCGLGTFYVMNLSTDGQTLEVFPNADGGGDVPLEAGALVRLRPLHTDYAIFREISKEIDGMSSPYVGLYSYGSFDAAPNWLNNTYPLPTTDNWATMTPIKLLRARYQHRGFDTWQQVKAEYQPEAQTVRIYGDTPQAGVINFVFAFPFLRPTSLADDITDLGLVSTQADIPVLGACAALSRTWESRRSQPLTQGDARRPTEVPPGANIGVARDFTRDRQIRINEELTRLASQFGYWQPVVGL